MFNILAYFSFYIVLLIFCGSTTLVNSQLFIWFSCSIGALLESVSLNNMFIGWNIGSKGNVIIEKRNPYSQKG